MEEFWAVIEAWVKEHLPQDMKLKSPASPAAIAAAEKTLGMNFPADFRASLAVHDGQDDDTEVEWLPAAHRLGSLESVVACFVDDRESADEEWSDGYDVFDRSQTTRQPYWDEKRIPIAGSAYWDYDRLNLDFCPGPKGTNGQVIVRWSAESVFLCSSFGELMQRTAEGMTSGRIVIAKGRTQWLSPRSRKPIHYTKFYN